ncbi:Cna B-type domain-containing protein [Bifidobacterium choloepi]|uniref:Cna B-type domain-containing protein n=1 Tax=Bifidobacterium choloepi TaxID=2614131 RepID=A0A6I5MZ84_9BIFI|nr:Cna B-type domain-containing protein [Bifidobacterium choloepi]NEG69958.1 Cna B-type domain-containing protein [Bifidobacterium choloepi]
MHRHRRGAHAAQEPAALPRRPAEWLGCARSGGTGRHRNDAATALFHASASSRSGTRGAAVSPSGAAATPSRPASAASAASATAVPRRRSRAVAAVIVVFALLLGCLTTLAALPATVAMAAEYDIGELGWVDTSSTELTFAGQPYSSGMTLQYGDDVTLKLHWTVPNSVTIHDGDTFVYDLPANIEFEEGKTYTLYDADGNACGTFVVTGGQVIVTYSTADGGVLGSNVSAYVTVTGTVTQAATGGANGGGAVFEFPGIGTIEATVEQQHSLEASKSGAVSTDDNTVFYFVVDVTSTGTNTNVRLEDSMGDLLTLLDDPSIAIYADADLTRQYAGSWYVETQDSHSFTLNIDSMTDGQTLYVVYYVRIDRQDVTAVTKSYQNYDRIRNTVTFSSDEDTTSGTTSRELWLDSSWSVTKSGEASDSGVITWTITVVPDADAQVTTASLVKDTVGSGQDVDGSASVTITCMHSRWWDGSPDTVTVTLADLLAGNVSLPLQSDGSLYPEYRLSYTTQATSVPEAGSGEKATYSNAVTVTPGDGNSPVTTTGTVTVGSDAVSLAKRYAGSATATDQLQWIVTFTALVDLPAGKTVVDSVDVDSSGNTLGTQQYFASNAQAVVYTDANCTQPYSGGYSTAVSAGQKTLTVTFDDAIARNTTLYIALVSYVNGSLATNATLYNTATSINKSVTATYSPVSDNMTKSTLYYYNQWNTADSSANGILAWQLWVHDVAADATSVTIADTLPAGTAYVAGSVTGYGNTATWNGSANVYPAYDGVSATVNADGTVTFTIAPGSAAFAQAQTSSGLYLVYNTTFDYTTGYGEYGNTAVISVSGTAQGPDTASVWAGPSNIVDKSSVYDGTTAPYVTYTVTVNASGATLNGGKTLTLTDVLGDALELRMDSVSIASKTTGAEIESAAYSYDPTTKTIVFKVPDATPIVISYKSLVLLQAGESMEGLATNSIALAGYADYGSDATTEIDDVIEARAGITSDSAALQIYKYADGDTTKPLNGAVFQVDELDFGLGDEESGAAVVSTSLLPGTALSSADATVSTLTSTLTSSTSGYATIGLATDVIYRITEITAPEGYCDVGAAADSGNDSSGDADSSDAAGADDPCADVTQPVIYLVFPKSTEAAVWTGVTVDGVPVTLAMATTGAGKTVTLQTYQWSVSNTGKVNASFTLKKTDLNGTALAGAVFELTKDGDATFLETWTSADCTGNDAGNSDDSSGSDAAADAAGMADVDDGTAVTSCTTTSATFAGLTAGTYTLTETTAPDGYAAADPVTVVVTESGGVIVNGQSIRTDDGNVLTIADQPLTTSVTTTKTWDDGDNQDGGRGTATFVLSRSTDGGSTWNVVTNQSKTVPNTANSTVTWNNLPVKDGDLDVIYSVSEVYREVDGVEYGVVKECFTGNSAAGDGTGGSAGGGNSTGNTADPTTSGTVALTCSFTNVHEPATTSVPVTKVWADDADEDELRPDSIVVELYADGVATGKTLTLAGGTGSGTADNSWTGEFKDLPAYDNGVMISYTVRETNVPDGYVATVAVDRTSGAVTVTNTHHPDSDYVWISKRDVGGNEIAGAELTVTGTVTATGEAIDPISWTSVADESTRLELEPGTYTLAETAAPTGYKTADPVQFTVVRADNGGLIVLVGGKQADDNTVAMTDYFTTTTVKVNKTSLTDGVGEIAGATLTLGGVTLAGETINPLTWTSTGTAKTVTLVPGTYRLHESAAPDGYATATDIVFTVNLDGTVSVDGEQLATNTVTMTDEPNRTNVVVSKTAVGGSAELAGAEFAVTGTTFEGDAIAPVAWTSTADGPVTLALADGTYMLTETKAPDGYDVSNSPIAFTVSGGQVYVGETAVAGNTIVVEDAVKQYTAVTATKRWEDDRDNDNYRSSLVVTAQLYRNGTLYAEQVLSDMNNWSVDWAGLPVYDDEGVRISWTVSETLSTVDGGRSDAVEAYRMWIAKRTALNGASYTIYNLHSPDSVDLGIVKEWDDADDQDGVRPASIGVVVYGTATCTVAGKEATCTDTLVTTMLRPDDGEWQWTIENLPANNAYGNPYGYTVVESPVAGYNGYDSSGTCSADSCSPAVETTDNDDGDTVVTFTNTHVPETTEVEVTKVWDDADDHNGTRPESVTVWLLSSLWAESNGWPVPQSTGVSDATGLWTDGLPSTFDGDCVDSDVATVVGVSCVVLGADNDWTYTFTGLPKYQDGSLVAYSLTEQFDDSADASGLAAARSLAEYTATLTNLTGTPVVDDDGNPVTGADGSVVVLGSTDHYVLRLTNTTTPRYGLPSTGGDGIGPWMVAAGALAVAIALVLALGVRDDRWRRLVARETISLDRNLGRKARETTSVFREARETPIGHDGNGEAGDSGRRAAR